MRDNPNPPKRRFFGILSLVVLAGRQPAFVLRTKFCTKTRAFQVAEFYRETDLGLYEAKTQENLTDFRVFYEAERKSHPLKSGVEYRAMLTQMG